MESERPHARDAALHVAAALELSGDLAGAPEDLAADARRAADAFRNAAIYSKPIGFYTWTPELEAVFTRDRWLQSRYVPGVIQPPGFGALAELSVLLGEQPALAGPYARTLDLYARLTDPFFDATPFGHSGTELVNVSARTLVTPGDGTLIAGFALGGTTARTVLIRAGGPALNAFGVGGALADPKLALYSGATKLAESDNWQASSELVDTFTRVGAFHFTARSRDAMLYLTLPPGLYTAQVSGLGSATGVALVEVYVLR